MTSRAPYLIATCGFPNFGDEVITAGWLRYLADAAPESTVWVDCPEPGLSAKLFEGIHPKARFTNTVWRMIAEAPSQEPEEMRAHLGRLIAHGGSPRFDLGLETLRDASSVHVLGGGYIHAKWPHHAGLIYAALAARNLNGAALYATGQGLAPVLGPEYGLAEALGQFDHLSVREASSADFLGIDVGLDDAFLAAPEVLKRSRRLNLDATAPDVLVCVQDDMGSPERIGHVRELVRERVAEAVAAGKSVGYVECIPGNDHPGFAALADLIPAENFYPFARAWNEGMPLRSGQHILTTRFHLHLLGSAAGARGTAYGISDDYYDEKHRSLVERGSGWEFVPASGERVPETTDSLKTRLSEYHEQKEAEAAGLYGSRNSATVTEFESPRPVTGSLKRLLRNR